MSFRHERRFGKRAVEGVRLSLLANRDSAAQIAIPPASPIMSRLTYIPEEVSTEAYLAALPAAGAHLYNYLVDNGQVGERLWVTTAHPFYFHIRIQLGSQLIYVRLEGLAAPGSRQQLARIASLANGHACLMPMHVVSGKWRPALPGSGLVPLQEALSPWRARFARLLRAGRPFDPVSLKSHAPMELTDWEVHESAVGKVSQMLRAEGNTILSEHPDPAVDPSIWFEGEHGKEWVIVRAVRHPQPAAPCPPADHVAQVAAHASQFSRRGSFVSVVVGNEDKSQPRLFRGGMGDYLMLRRIPLTEASSPRAAGSP